MSWKEVPHFKDVHEGDRVRLVRPETMIPDDPEPVKLERAAYEGVATHVNWRGEMNLDGHPFAFYEDGVFGDWWYEIYVWQED